MPKAKSLDRLIAKRAVEFGDEIGLAAMVASNEEEIRIATGIM